MLHMRLLLLNHCSQGRTRARTSLWASPEDGVEPLPPNWEPLEKREEQNPRPLLRDHPNLQLCYRPSASCFPMKSLYMLGTRKMADFFFLSDHFIPWFSIGKCFRYPQNPNFYTFHLVVSLKFLFRNSKVMDGLSASVLCHVSPEEMRLECSSDWGWRWEWGASWRMGRGGRRQASENTDEKPHSFGQRQNKI